MPKKEQSPHGLRYIGDGTAIDNVPARDLAQADINTIADDWEQDPGVVCRALIASGLYAAAPANDTADEPPAPAA